MFSNRLNVFMFEQCRISRLTKFDLKSTCFCNKRLTSSASGENLPDKRRILIPGLPVKEMSFNPFVPPGNFLRFVWYIYRYDQTFSYGEKFMATTRAVYSMLTERLFNKDYESFRELVSVELYEKLKESAESLSDEERRLLLGFSENDIYLGYIYNCAFRDHKTEAFKKYFDIHIVFNSIKDKDNTQEQFDKLFHKKPADGVDDSKKVPPVTFEDMQKVMQDRLVNGNISLTKQILPHSDADWTVSYLNYHLR